jgi:hypothetical protein
MTQAARRTWVVPSVVVGDGGAAWTSSSAI